MKRYLTLISLIIAGATFTLFSGTGCKGRDASKNEIVVGGKDFTEQFLLAEMAGALLEQAGFDVDLRTGVGSAIARKALENDQVDLYYEYTGTAYTVFYEQSDPEIMRDPTEVYQWVKGKDAAKKLTWLQRVDFNNTYTLIMRRKQAAELGIASISDLARYVNEQPDGLHFAVGVEFYERPDGFKKLVDTYGFQPSSGSISKMSIGLTYRALREEQVDVAMGFATDGRITAFGFISLEDDKQFFPVYNPAPVIRTEVLEKHPTIRDVLAPLAESLTTDTMRSLNAKVDIEHVDARKVAIEWLTQEGLLEE